MTTQIPDSWELPSYLAGDLQEPSYEDWMSSLPAGDLMSVDAQQALEREGFFEHEPGVYHRPVTHRDGTPIAAHHIITYEPGNRRPSNDERAPWILTTDPETVGIAFRHLDGLGGALDAANADRAQIRRMSKKTTQPRPTWESAR